MLGKISFSISIDTPAHVSFGDTPEDAIFEIVNSVRELMKRVENTDSVGNSDLNCTFFVRDINGNTIGTSYLDIEYEEEDETNEEELEEDEIELLEKSAKSILEKDGDCTDVEDCSHCPMYNEDCTSIDRVKFLTRKGYHI